MKLLLTYILTLFSYCIFAQGVSNAGTAPGTHASESEEGYVSGTLGQSMSGTGESEEGDATQGMEQPSEVEMFTTNLLGESDLNICFGDLNGRIGWVSPGISGGVPFNGIDEYNDAVANGEVAPGTPVIDPESIGSFYLGPFVYEDNNGCDGIYDGTETLMTDPYSLPSGCYIVFVIDAVGNQSTPTSIFIESPSQITSLIPLITNECDNNADGSISVTIEGGTPFSIGDEYIYSWTGPNGFTSSTKDITNLSAGVYTLIAKDQNDCMQNFNFTVNSMSCGASQIIDLIEGWSIISTYIDPIDDNIENVFDDVIGNVSTQPNFIEVVVKDELGNVFWPYFGLNSIGDLTIGKGYQVKMNFFNQLEIYGDVIPYNTPLILDSGWGLLGYLHQDPYNVEFLMESIVDELNLSASNLIILKAGDGNVYWPTFSLNNIGNLNPGEGYQIKMNTSQVFSYPNISGQRNDNFNIQESIHFEKPMQTDQNMTIGIPYYAWQETPKIGDEIAAFDQNGNIIGISIFNGNHLALTIWGDDATTYHKDGANEYEKISFKLWDSVNNIEEELEFVWERGGDSYIKNGISIAQNIILNKQGNSKNIISITDILGREINSEIKNQILFFKYDDGNISTKYIFR